MEIPGQMDVSNNKDIEWRRVAEPQHDQYDTLVALEYSGWANGRPPVRTADCPTIFDGQVAVQPLAGEYQSIVGLHGLHSAPLDSVEMKHAVELVRRWPVAFRQFQLLMHTFYPMIMDDPGMHTGQFRGSASHSFASAPGTMCATINDPAGLAQAFVHEMAHTKLRALGIQIEGAGEFIVNQPSELYESPIRKDKPRPMTAVFHAEYSFIYVTELDIMMLDGAIAREESNRILALLARNVPRVEEGLRTLTSHARLDRKGERLMEGFLKWAGDTVRRGRIRLGKSASLGALP
jgi:hypothetical protein